jgi:uncharacterized RDD family membrane protein YckC
MICTKCGASMESDAAFCAACGTQVIRVRQTPAIGWNPQADAAAAAAEQELEAYASAYADVTATQPIAYAGFWLRALAYVIDLALLGVATMPLLAVLTPLAGNHWEEYSKLSTQEMFNLSNPAVLPFMMIVMPVVVLCGWLYYALCESSSWQGTLGKKVLGLRVSGLDGRPVTFARASGRFAGRIVTGFVPFGIGYLLAGFTKRKQALHDIIAGCLVLRRG